MVRTTMKHTFILLFTLVIIIGSSITIGIASDIPQNTSKDSQIATDTTSGETSTQPTYLTIQEEINQASPGSTVQIPAGIYTEILTINKPLTLIGKEPTHTIIHPTSPNNGYAIQITAANVTLTGLDISNNGPGLYTTAVKISVPHTTIQHCIIHDTPVGIAIWSTDNFISDCDFQHCNDDAIVFLGTTTTVCARNTIQDCTFIKNCDGIELQYASRNTIKHCDFSDNIHAGIDAIASSNNENTFSHCTFSQNQGFGLYLAASSSNTITNCDFTNDVLTLVSSSQNNLLNSQILHISLMDDSSLHIINCGTLEKSTITSIRSQYDIQNDQPLQRTQTTITKYTHYQSFLLFLQSHIRSLKTILG